MKIELRWETMGDKRVLLYDFEPSWRWDDFYTVKAQADAMLEVENNRVPLIFDLRRAPNMPPGMILHSRNVVESRHPKGSPVILLGANRLVQAAFDIVKRMLGENTEKLTGDVMILKTWEEAVDYLKPRTFP
jgi:hypothetical protein